MRFLVFVTLFVLHNHGVSCQKDSNKNEIGYDYDIKRRIINGYATSISKHPYQVFVLTTDGIDDFRCGGSIISNVWIITAAHCLTNSKVVYVRAGSSRMIKGGVVRNPSQEFQHEKYSDITKQYDIALIKVSEPFEWTSDIKPVKLPDEDYKVLPGGLVVTGWGVNENSMLQEVLQEVIVELVSNEKCNEHYKIITDLMICAGTDGKDACQGDSGGPLVQNGTLVGIVSFGDGCGKFPGVYTGVPKMRSWIRDKTGV